MNIVIPIAGWGTRFMQQGYATPKSFLPISITGDSVSMYKTVIENMKHIFSNEGNLRFYIVCRKSQLKYFSLDVYADYRSVAICPINSDGLGAVSDILKIKDYINNPYELVIANCDQIVSVDPDRYNVSLGNKSPQVHQVHVLTHEVIDGPHGYLKVDDKRRVINVAEKEQISNTANAGVIYFKRGDDFVDAAKKLMESEQYKVNDEYHVFSTLNILLNCGIDIYTYPTDKYLSFGTPEDYEKNRGFREDYHDYI